MIEYNLLDSIQQQREQISYWFNTIHLNNIQKNAVLPVDDLCDMSILSKLNDIYLDGIGYHDSVGTIAFPLVIALFAFSFPFIFQMVNHINDKYESKLLSYVFRTAFSYKLFWVINVINVTYMLIYGTGTLFYREFFLESYSRYWNTISLVIVSMYVFSILCFVSYCVKFNNPDRLIAIIGRRQKWEKQIVNSNKFKIAIKTYVRLLLHRKDKAGNQIFKSARRMVEQWNDKTPQTNFNDRLIEIARYAIRKGDVGLFRNVLDAFGPIIESEKKSVIQWGTKNKGVIKNAGTHFQTFNFFEMIFSQSQLKMLDNMNESSLVYTLLNSFDRSKYMGYGNCLGLCKCLCRLVDSENITLLEKYIERSRFYFGYVEDLPKKSFVIGGDITERNSVVANSKDDWIDLSRCHFLAFAYCFEKGHYSLLKLLIKPSYNSLYPTSMLDTLLQYAYSKKQSWRLHTDLIFDRIYDVDVLLARYTVALLMILDNNESVSGIVTADIIDLIEKELPVLKQEAEHVIKNGDLRNVFPQIAKRNFVKVLDKCLNELKHLNGPLEENELHINTKKRFSVSVFLLKLLGMYSTSNQSRQNLYSKALEPNIQNHFKHLFGQFENDLLSNLPESLFSGNPANKLESFTVNSCQLLISKYYFIYPTCYQYGSLLYREYVEEFAARFIYLTLSAFRDMNIQIAVKTSATFDLFFQDFTKGKIEEYVLVGIETPFDAILNIRYQNNEFLYEEVVPYISIETIGKYGLLKDLDNYDYFKDSLLIVPKNGLPAIVDICEYKNVDVRFKDVSNKETMNFDVETTVDINKKVIYSKQTKIAMVKFKQLQM